MTAIYPRNLRNNKYGNFFSWHMRSWPNTPQSIAALNTRPRVNTTRENVECGEIRVVGYDYVAVLAEVITTAHPCKLKILDQMTLIKPGTNIRPIGSIVECWWEIGNKITPQEFIKLKKLITPYINYYPNYILRSFYETMIDPKSIEPWITLSDKYYFPDPFIHTRQ